MQDKNEGSESIDVACNSCSLHANRRDFLRDSAMIVAGVIASMSSRTASAASLPARAISALSASKNTVNYAVPMANGVNIDRPNEVVLTRWNGVVYAFALSCPHQKTALRWIEADTRFQCPKHKSKYQPDGTFISGKATRGMDRYSIRRDGGTIVVDIDALHKQDADPTGWAAAMVRVSDGEK